MDAFKFCLLTPKPHLTQRHQDELLSEVTEAVKSTSIILMVPVFTPEVLQPFVRQLARSPKLASKIQLEEFKVARPYKYEALADWAMQADRVMAFPSRATQGRIVDRVWGTVSILRSRGRFVVISYPKDK